jgi:hypothetical protein
VKAAAATIATKNTASDEAADKSSSCPAEDPSAVTDTAAPVAPRAHRATKRYIYAFGGGRAEGHASMRDLLGGKGAGRAEMTNAGLPVPPGFTVTTEACNDYFAAGEKLPDGLWDDVVAAMEDVERETSKGFGDPANPLLVSVRSGAKFRANTCHGAPSGACSGSLRRAGRSIRACRGSRPLSAARS